MSHSNAALALMIGNSRYHWAFFSEKKIIRTWHLLHQDQYPQDLQVYLQNNIPLVIASVVPNLTQYWLSYTNHQLITLTNIPIKELYPTLGIDRALALLGAKLKYNFPCLVIDAGTALTYTGCGLEGEFVGGAIVPGLGLQYRSLDRNTGQLPSLFPSPSLPTRWGRDTPTAIHSGILLTMIAGIVDFIQSWKQQYPYSPIILTGGDANILFPYLQRHPSLAHTSLNINNDLIYHGMIYCYHF